MQFCTPYDGRSPSFAAICSCGGLPLSCTLLLVVCWCVHEQWLGLFGPLCACAAVVLLTFTHLSLVLSSSFLRLFVEILSIVALRVWFVLSSCLLLWMEEWRMNERDGIKIAISCVCLLSCCPCSHIFTSLLASASSTLIRS